MPTNVKEALNQAQEFAAGKSGWFTWEKVIYTIIMVVVGLIVIKLILKGMNKALSRLDFDESIKRLLRTGLRILMLFILTLIVLSYLNISVTSLVAVLSVVGLALSLAVQNLLSNVAGGLQLLSTKPFEVGDYIEAGGVAGTVTETGLFYTKMRTPDNKLIQVTNKEISEEKIVNYSAERVRRVDLMVSASYDSGIEGVKASIRRVLEEHPLVLSDPEALVRVSCFGESSIQYVVRAWCATKDYWDVHFDVLEGIKEAFDIDGISMTYNHLNIHVISDIRKNEVKIKPKYD